MRLARQWEWTGGSVHIWTMENNELTIKWPILQFEYRISLCVVGNYTEAKLENVRSPSSFSKVPTNSIPGGTFLVAYICPASWRRYILCTACRGVPSRPTKRMRFFVLCRRAAPCRCPDRVGWPAGQLGRHGPSNLLSASAAEGRLRSAYPCPAESRRLHRRRAGHIPHSLARKERPARTEDKRSNGGGHEPVRRWPHGGGPVQSATANHHCG